MNWLGKILGYRDRDYRGSDFSVRIKDVAREAVEVIHTRQGASLRLGGERIGKKWEGIEVRIPPEIEGDALAQIVADLESAFHAMDYGYVIARLASVDVLNEAEQQAAIADLREMGYEVEVSPDRKQIRQRPVAGAPRRDAETLREEAPRMMSLIQAIHGTRPRFEILAKSKDR